MQDKAGRVLLVINLQDAFRHEPEFTRCGRFIEEHKNEYIRVIRILSATPKGYREENPNYGRYLGYTEETMTTDEIRKAITVPNTIVKYGYGMPGNISDISSVGYLPTNASYDVIGCNTESSVMAVCFGLFDRGYDFRVLTDCCYTTGGYRIQKAATELMKRSFGRAVIG